MPNSDDLNLNDARIVADGLPPEDAIRFWRQRANLTWDEAKELSDAARDRAFYVTGLLQRDLANKVSDALRKALEDGETLEDFKKRIPEIIQNQGWKDYRVETIFRTNMQTAYAAGRYAKMNAVKKTRPYWQYIAIMDKRTRPSHAVLHEKIYPADHEFWESNYPPNGFRCRCAVRTLSKRQIDSENLEVQKEMPKPQFWTDPATNKQHYVQFPGAEKGFRNNPAKDWLEGKINSEPVSKALADASLPEPAKNTATSQSLTPKRQSADQKLFEKRTARLLEERLQKRDTTPDYSERRKKIALWAKKAQIADQYVRGKCREVWSNATDIERDAIYAYTEKSEPYNRPLSGYQKPENEKGSGFEEKFYKGPGKVWIDYEDGGDIIRRITELIRRSKYDFDMWLQRGSNADAIEANLGLPRGSLMKMNDRELQNLVGEFFINYSFTSCSVNEGGGLLEGKDIIWKVFAPRGTEMIYAEPFSHYGMGAKRDWDGNSDQKYFGQEAEMLVQRGASFFITKIEKKHNIIYMELEIHPENGYRQPQQDPNEWTGSRQKYR